MNKEDIKKALEYCTRSEGIEGCEKCPYSSIYGCNDTLCKDTLNLITEQEKEINALQEENRRLDEYVSCTLSAQEFDEEIKQAKIDVLNELKEKYGKSCSEYYPLLIELTSDDIDELIKEYEK